MPSASATVAATRRILKSPLVDLLVGPHGIDRYLELIRPDLTIGEARAEIVDVRRQTPRSVTLTLRPNRAWAGFEAGQFVRVGVEIDGVRTTRTYSPSCSQHGADALLELTVTAHPHGRVSPYLRDHVRTGAFVHLGAAQGDFVLPAPRPERLVLISGGSGVTPVLSMLRTLADERHPGEVLFLHYSRTAADALYVAELRELAARHPWLSVQYVATREGGARLTAGAVRAHGFEPARSHAAVCGPPALIDAVKGVWADAGADPDRVLAETFTAPRVMSSGGATDGTLPDVSGTIEFLRAGCSAPVAGGTLLEQAEAAGLTPTYGCRMGICHTCTSRKAHGAVRNVLTGEVSGEEDEDIQLCVSVPAGDVALEI
jgi:ferredoxin-NADP reductase